MPNNREWALFMILGALLILVVVVPTIRGSAAVALRTLTNPKLASALTLVVVWTSAEVLAGARFGIWDNSLVTDTVLWFVLSAFAMFLSLGQAPREPKFFRRRLTATVGAGAILGAYFNAATFNIPLEFVLQSMVFFLGLMIVVAKNPEQQPTKRLCQWLMVAVAVVYAVNTAAFLASNWDATTLAPVFKQAALPVWLTVGVVPCVYLIALLGAYGQIFWRVDWHSDLPGFARLRRRAALVCGLNLRMSKVAKFDHQWVRQVNAARGFRDTRQIVKTYRSSLSEPPDVP